MNRWRAIGLVVLGSLAGGLLLSSFDGRGFTAAGVVGYACLLAVALTAILWVGRSMLPDRAPSLILALAVGAMALRIGVGVALARALPEYGYDENPQNAGYVYWDSYKRDADAWQRARSDTPLLAAFTSPKVSDQYGGMLFLSAATYRYLSGGIHRPILVVVLTGAASGLALIAIWGFAHVGLGAASGVAAAWIAFLAPEAVLLGSSQMREPFLIWGLAMALFGYVLAGAMDSRRGVPWMLAGMIVLLFFSPPTALAGAIALGMLALWEGRRRPKIPRWVWWLGVPFAIIGLLLAIQSWARLEELSGSFGAILFEWWKNAGAAWRVGQAAEASDQLQVLLDRLPAAGRLPFLVAYGLVQPFLPAAIAATGNALWKAIAILRSLGWFVLLPMLIYGTVTAFRRRGWRSLEAYLAVLVWVSALLASYRAPGYQWDNPRYRTVFLVAEAALAGWAWVGARERKDPWLLRLFVATAIATGVILTWYVGRYQNLPSLSFEATLAAAALLTGGFLGGCLLWDRQRRGPPEPGRRLDHV